MIRPVRALFAGALILPLLVLCAADPALAASRAKPAAAAKPAHAAAPDKTAETLQFGRFGTVTLYHATPHPQHVVLFLSGDGGWNLGVVDMARTLTSMDALVIGISLPAFQKKMEATKEACHYPAADLEMLSKYVQKKLEYPTYVTPVIVGYSSGATLAYAVIVQAPPNTFRGAISMGFCPDLPLHTPLCKGQGLTWGPGPQGKGVSFLPASTLEVPWIAFQGQIDQVCFPDDVEKYVKQVRGAEVVPLPLVGHGFSKPQHWEAEFRAAFLKLVKEDEQAGGGAELKAPAAGELKDLPLVEVPARSAGDTLALFVSGDGGWAQLDRSVSAALAERGIAVVGLSSLQYFWKSRTPEGTADDAARILRHYLAAWKRQKVLLVGYSFGADVLAPLAERLPADLQDRLHLLALIGPSHTATFEFHVGEWLGLGGGEGLPVVPAVKKLAGAGKRVVCLYGEDEKRDSPCPEIGALPGARAAVLSGAHHFGGRYDVVAEEILK